jgi:subtilisin-like proprotein convertase family protein
VTRTFTRSGTITIPDKGAATPYPSLLQVGGLRAGMIQDVNVTVSGFSHDFPEDVEIIVVGPDGQTAVVLMSNVGGSDDISNVTLTFDDQAGSFLPLEAQIVSGSYKPTMPGVAPNPESASLRELNGLNPNGAWRLYVSDVGGSSVGSIAGWALTVRTRVRV